MLAMWCASSFHAIAQSVSSGKETIDKIAYSGLILSQGIPDKYMSSYWEEYLAKFGKVRGKKGSYRIEKASVKSLSSNPVQIVSQVSAVNKSTSKVFAALGMDGAFITLDNDQAYRAAESILKDFADYAASRDRVRTADEDFTSSEKTYLKLQREIEEKSREIEKTEKKLTELRAEVQKGKADLQSSLPGLQSKQKVLEAAKSKVPNLKQ